jgi:hypothetical protein
MATRDSVEELAQRVCGDAANLKHVDDWLARRCCEDVRTRRRCA